MTSPQEQIEAEVRAALKAGDKERLATLRLLLNSIKNERIRIGAEVDQAGFVQLVRKATKQRLESAEQYRAGNRPELAEREEREAEILKAYLPPEVDDDEIRQAIRELVSAEGLSGPGAIGPVMKAMLDRFSGRADGATINRIAREVLAG